MPPLSGGGFLCCRAGIDKFQQSAIIDNRCDIQF